MIRPASPRWTNGRLERRRAEGKLVNLEASCSKAPLAGAIGIGHTRWATHGAPERDATPIRTRPSGVAVVHNGIIENFRELQGRAAGRRAYASRPRPTPRSWRSSSPARCAEGTSPVEAVAATLPRLRGAFALAFLFAGDDDLLIGARHGPPLAVGYGEGEMYLGSDALALAPFTDAITYLEDGDWAVLSRARRRRSATLDGRPVERPRQQRPGRRPSWSTRATTATSWRRRSTSSRRSSATRSPTTSTSRPARSCCRTRCRSTSRRCSRHVDLGLRHRLLRRPGRQVLVRAPGPPAGRDRRRLRVPLPRAAAGARRRSALFVSQSGETADTLAALRYAKAQGQHDRRRRQRARPRPSRARATSSLPTLAGPEIGVASTKAFTCQLAVLLCLAIAAGRARGTLSPRRRRPSSSTRSSRCRA